MASSSSNSYWPKIEDSDKAIEVMHGGAGAAAISSGLSAAICIAAIWLGHPVIGFDAWGLIDAAFFAVVAWRVYRLSLGWAVAGLTIFVVEKVLMFADNPKTAGFIVAIIFFLYYLNAVRAGLYLRKAKKIATISPSHEVSPLLEQGSGDVDSTTVG
jgi:hypothetical protein